MNFAPHARRIDPSPPCAPGYARWCHPALADIFSTGLPTCQDRLGGHQSYCRADENGGRSPGAILIAAKSVKRASRNRDSLRIVLTCIGRRVELLEAFRRAARALRIDLALHGTDLNMLAPAMHLVDHAHIVPANHKPEHITALIGICRRHRIDAVIPLLDSELLPLARHVEDFSPIGTRVIISSERVVSICRDKMKAYETLSAAGIDTPQTWTWDEAVRKKNHQFPYYMKPREGSAGMGNYRVESLAELKVLGPRVPNPIVQEFVEGVEHTLDIYTALDGRPRCIVPRRRMEVRSGEASKCCVVKDPAIIEVGRRVAEVLAETVGVITMQCIVTPQKRVRVIEINPRFGGGVPLSIQAGADFPKWLMADLLGRNLRYNPDAYQDGLTMLRYDQSVFATGLSGKPARP